MYPKLIINVRCIPASKVEDDYKFPLGSLKNANHLP